MKKLGLLICTAAFLTASALTAADTAPKTVIHVISVKWKAGTEQAKIDQVLQIVRAMPSQNHAILHVWTNPIKKQLPEGYDHVIVMEFSSEDALKQYVDSPAQKRFYEVYMPIREESRTSDISN